MHRALLSLAVVLAVCAPAIGHPIPKDNHDRTIVVHLTPHAIVVDYRLEVDELSAFKDLPASEANKLTDRRELPPVFLRYFGPVLANNLDATLDGNPLTFTCVRQQDQLLDHIRCDYRFEAKWAPESGKKHVCTIEEGNYHNDSVSKVLLSVHGFGNVELLDVQVPSSAVEGEAQQRKATAAFTVAAATPLAVAKMGLPPDIDLERLGPEPGQSVSFVKPAVKNESSATAGAPMGQAGAGMTKLESVPAVPPPLSTADKPATDAVAPPPRGQFDRLLDLILDTQLGIGLALLIAAGLGAVHALAPGHGKTLVAAYLVGERGTFGHALLLGVVTTLTHTGAVLIIAAVLFFFYDKQIPPALMPVLGLVGGLMVTSLGLWLLLRRVAGQADHVHLGGGHHGHDHGHSHGGLIHSHGGAETDHAHDVPAGVGVMPLIWLGITGGIVPCGDAIAILVAVIGKGYMHRALPILLAFSAGLASTLVAIGISVVFARRMGDVKLGESKRWRKIVRLLPIISAVLVTGVGLFLCWDSFHGGH